MLQLVRWAPCMKNMQVCTHTAVSKISTIICNLSSKFHNKMKWIQYRVLQQMQQTVRHAVTNE